ncbi:hypothetical protein RB195_015759 [Necator americanus]|uniref:SCP domain-containing protein n=1 Tax=Necator americanus TaxID=51031 RepID=A0ABR1E6P2_NECAM
MMLLCYRRLLATGWGKSGENYAKPATKMIELQYDKALEDKTVTKIKNCASSSSSAIGENFWSKEVTATNNIGEDGIEKVRFRILSPFDSICTSSGVILEEMLGDLLVLKKAIYSHSRWLVGGSLLKTTGFGDDRKNKKSVISAANIAYDGATKVGCAIDFGAACPKLGKLYIMCIYDESPAIDDVIYEAGNEACAKCASTGTTPVCSPIGGLCVAAS